MRAYAGCHYSAVLAAKKNNPGIFSYGIKHPVEYAPKVLHTSKRKIKRKFKFSGKRKRLQNQKIIRNQRNGKR